MQESLQRVLAWAKANPVLAGGIVVAVAVVGYFLLRGGGSGEPTPLTTDDIGSGGGVGGDDIIPIEPIPDLLLPDPGYIGSGSWSSAPSGPVSVPVTGSRANILAMEAGMKSAGFVPQEAVSTGRTRTMPNVESWRPTSGPPVGAQPTFRERQMPDVQSYRLPTASTTPRTGLSGQGFTTYTHGGVQQ